MLTAGTRLGPYEILAPIGEGGMGEVWKARDSRLNRTVAVKISAERFNENFAREAHAIAALNHPHVCTLYDVGPNYLVMEYVEGHLLKGPLPLADALRYGAQIADALEAAHKNGIVHRDLKPANVMVTKAGVKILDFGLASTKEDGAWPARPEAWRNLPAEEIPTVEMWNGSKIEGTLPYMSPEQLQGKPTDARSDIFSFGALLYEMVTGKRAYQADNAASVIAEIMKGAPLSVMSVKPAALARVISRCLARDPDDRWQSARDLQVNLEWIGLGLDESEGHPAAPAPTWKRWLWPGIAFLAGLLATGLVMLALRRPVEERTLKLSLLPPEGQTFLPGSVAGPPALSADGQMIAFVAEATHPDSAEVRGEQLGQQMLWVRALDSLSARMLAGTEGARSPFWSPDGKALGFFSQDKLMKMELADGAVQALASVPGGFSSAGAWSAEDKILYAPSNLTTLFAIPASGGTPTAATRIEEREIGHFWPQFLGGGRFLFQAGPQVYAGQLGSLARSGVLSNALHAVYAPAQTNWPAYLLFVRDSVLYAQRFDPGKMAISGEAKPIAEGIAPQDFVAVNGMLAFRNATQGAVEIVTFDRQGRRIGTFEKQPGAPGFMRYSPDGKTLAMVLLPTSGGTQSRTADIWLRDMARGVTSRFTFNGASSPVWSPDGSRLLFSGADGLYTKAANGTGGQELFLKDAGFRNPTDWSEDGRYLLIGRNDPKTGFDIWLLENPTGKGTHKMTPLVQTPANEGLGRFAPGAGAPKWVAYVSEESGVNEVYVTSMPGGAQNSAQGKWQISTGGGYSPRWRGDGRELFYLGPDLRTVMAVDIDAGPFFRAGTPHALFKVSAPPNGAAQDQGFAVNPDGKTFVLAVTAPDTASAIHVVLNWQAELGK